MVLGLELIRRVIRGPVRHVAQFVQFAGSADVVGLFMLSRGKEVSAMPVLLSR